MLIISLVLTAVISYLLGSCNSSIIVVRLLKNEDIREHGSKNAGLTNTLRCYGKVPALLTLAGDLAKGVMKVFSETETRIIGTRHGEKLYETLMTREEKLKLIGMFEHK